MFFQVNFLQITLLYKITNGFLLHTLVEIQITEGISASFTVKFWRNRLSNLLMALQKDASFSLQIKHLLCLTNALNMSSLLLTLT